MIKPGIYTIEAVEKYHSLLLTGKHETGTTEELRRRGRPGGPRPGDGMLRSCRQERQSIADDALEELESTVEDPALADPYYNIRERGRELNRLMRQVPTPLGWLLAQMKDLVELTADKTDDVFTYPTQIFMISCLHVGYPETQEAIENCYASFLNLEAAIKECNASCHIFRREILHILDEIPHQLTKEERLQDEIDELLEDIEKIKDVEENKALEKIRPSIYR